MHTRNLLKIALALVAAVLGTASTAWCDTITLTLISSGGGVYEYAVAIPAGGTVTFDGGQTITLTGLSGVTGASIESPLSLALVVQSFTSTSVTFVEPLDANSSIQNLTGATVYDGTLIVDSTSPSGTVDYTMQTSSGSISGTVGGPVATPEPGSFSMLLTSVLGLGALVFFSRREGMLRHSPGPA